MIRSTEIVLAAIAAALLPLTARAQTAPPTFTRDIAPIVFAHCAPCHRPGEAAPFNLLTYDDVRSRARTIVEVTGSRYMPPWKPTADSGPFVGERRLSEAQIETVARWVDAGAPHGDPAALPAAPVWSGGWRLGTPDLVVTLPEPFALGADGPDVFRNFVVPIPVETMKFVAGIEFRAGTAGVIHHANLRLDASPASRERDALDPLPGFEGALGPSARYPDGYFLGWTPGQLPPLAAKGMAWRLAPGTDLVLQLHVRTTGKREQVRPSVGFFFTADAPVRVPLALRLGKQNIEIAPGERYVARDRYQLPVDVEVHAIHPHAHYRAREITAVADLPDGRRRPLIRITDWDFNWQDVYRYVTPIVLPRGTTITMEYAYDNSAGNARNPDRPPRRIRWGQNSSDEMGDLWLQVVTPTPQDRARLVADVMPKVLAEDAAGYGMLLRADPANPALTHGKAATHYNLGSLLAAERRFDEAAAEFRNAIALRPDHSETHNNLGVVLKALGQIDQAIEEFRRAIALDATNADARANLAAIRRD